MRENLRVLVIAGLIILIFPVLITLIINKVNVNKKTEVEELGRIIEIDNGKYTIEMDMEDFIPCVLMAQMSIDSPKEVLKAQTVVIRTYILKQMGQNTRINSTQLGLPYVSYGKLQDMWFREYRMESSDTIGGMLGNLTGLGASRIFEQNWDYLNNIISKTKDMVLKKDGELILPLYHGVSNGQTRSGTEILGTEYNYLKSVKCDTDLQAKDYLGVTYVSIKQLKDKLAENDIVIYKDKKEVFNSENLDAQTLLSLIDISNKDETGYVLSVNIADTEIMADDFAKALELNSTSFEISEYEKGIRITTKGKGHGFGMSLAYAEELAKSGMEWKKILKFFYDGTINSY